MTLLDINNVAAGFGEVLILNDLSMSVAEGEIVAVLGANGSGKSTALKTVAGLTNMVEGVVALAGQDISQLPPHRRAALGIAYVPQIESVFPDLTVDENLKIGAFLRPENEAAGRREVLALFPRLAERRDQLASSMSGGERRMLAIAQALLLRPKLLVLDEPSSDLAPNTVNRVFEILRKVHEQLQIPILLVEQNVRKALDLADRVYVLARGGNAWEGSAADVDMDLLRALFIDGTIHDRP